MSTVSGSLITRNYANFKGVDFTDEEVSLTRSPDALNIWKDYKKLGKAIETRPELELVNEYDNTIWGVFFYKVGNKEMKLVHCGTKLYRELDGVRTELFTGLNPRKSYDFVDNNIWYLKDGINYLKYDGQTLSQVEDSAFIPTTTISRNPLGGGTTFQDVNMMSAYRKNSFVGDGESKVYHLDTKGLDVGTNTVTAVVDGTILNESTDFEVNRPDGIITFKVAPSKPLTDGQDNVVITFKKTVAGYMDRIKKCTLLQVFDNRVFFSGNQDYPNTVWHSSLNDPTYCSDLDYYNEGLDLSPVKDMVAGNNALWVFKEPSQANTTIFYHNPTIDSEYGKVYPSTHSSISTGCVGRAINFSDDICFFSDRGMEAVTQDITTEQVLSHRSSLIDSKLLAETNYKNMILEEWEGYLLVFIDNKVYLADSRGDQSSTKYEWFYWELPINITCTRVKDGVLYLGTNNAIYKFGYDENEYKEVTFTKGTNEYYLEGESKQEVRSGKNYLKNIATSQNFYGIDYKINADKSVSVTGTSDSQGVFDLSGIIENTYGGKYLVGSPSGASNLSYCLIVTYFDADKKWVAEQYETGGGLLLKSDYPIIRFGILVRKDKTVNNALFKPMVVDNLDTEYEEYGASPTPDYPSEIVNTYKAGKYRTVIDGKQYRFELKDDLRSAGTYKDRIYLDDKGLHLIKNIKVKVLNGSETYANANAVEGIYRYNLDDTTVIKSFYAAISTHFKMSNREDFAHISDVCFGTHPQLSQFAFFTKFSTSGEFRTWLQTNNVTINYQLETPITTDIDYLVSPLSYWTLPFDKFNYPQYLKSTNKKGSVVEAEGSSITVSARTNNSEWEEIETHIEVRDAFVSRIKRKKFKDIQLRFSSHMPFELYSATLECYVGAYVKRL